MQRFISLLIYLISPFVGIKQSIKGKVVRIADGDTITLLDSANRQTRIRLHGIDCPENGQDFVKIAKKLTSDLCFSKIVTVDVNDIEE